MSKLSLEQVLEITARYTNGEKPTVLGNEFGVSEQAIRRMARSHGAPIFPKGFLRRVTTPDVEAEIARRHHNNESGLEIAKAIGISQHAVLDSLRRLGLTIVPHMRTYQLNVHAFADARTNPTARYWLGLLYADGAIVTKKGRPIGMKISLTETDGEHLELFKLFLGSTHPLYIESGKNNHLENVKDCAALHINSLELAASLLACGLTPRKSKTAVAPDWLSMDGDFWRGVCDGDGSIFEDKYCPGNPILSLCGSQAMMEQFRSFVLSICPKCKAHVKLATDKGCYLFRIRGSNTVAILNALHYAANSVALERKKKIALKCLQWVSNQGRAGQPRKRRCKGI